MAPWGGESPSQIASREAAEEQCGAQSCAGWRHGEVVILLQLPEAMHAKLGGACRRGEQARR